MKKTKELLKRAESIINKEPPVGRITQGAFPVEEAQPIIDLISGIGVVEPSKLKGKDALGIQMHMFLSLLDRIETLEEMVKNK